MIRPILVILILTSISMRAQVVHSDTGKHISYTTVYDWSEGNPAWPALRPGIQQAITLSPCPKGVDTSASPRLGGPNGAYPIYISDGASSESVYVTGGTCRSDATEGTVVFATRFSHPVGVSYLLKSASAGIQEAINDNCGISTLYFQNGYCHVVIPPTGPATEELGGYDIRETIYFHAHQSILDGYGAVLNCYTRGPCLQIGNLLNSNYALGNTIEGLSFRAPVDRKSDAAYEGSTIISTLRSRGMATIQTLSPHNFETGDRVTVMSTDIVEHWGDVPAIAVLSPTTFTYSRDGAEDIPIHEGPGLVALTYVAILDNGTSTHFVDIQDELTHEYGRFNHMFDFWDDENATVDHYNNNGIGLNTNPNWMGSTFYSGGAHNLPDRKQQLAPVISVKDSTLTNVNCFDVTNSNGLYVRDTVCQNSIVQARVSNLAGNYQGAFFENIYSESAANANGPQQSPWGGLGVAGLIGGPVSAGAFVYRGQGEFSGGIAGFGTTPVFVWYVVAHDQAQHTVTSPLPVFYADLASEKQIKIRWPRISNGSHPITYDLLRARVNGSLKQAAAGYVAPNSEICTGGATGICGSIAIGIDQCPSFVCSFVDNIDGTTDAYDVKNGDFIAAPAFWPGQAVLSNRPLFAEKDFSAFGIGMNGMPSIYATFCSYGLNTNGGYSSCLGSQMATNNAVSNQTALLLTDGSNTGSGGVAGAKGRLNFITNGTGGSAPHHVITLFDSNPRKTVSTTGYRPAADIGDVWIGLDSRVQMAFGSKTAISNYIGNTGDDIHWLERLTIDQKTFSVPLALRELSTPPKTVDGNATLYANSETHKLEISSGKEPFYPVSQTIVHGSISLDHSTIASGDCAAVVSASVRGLEKTDVVGWTLSGAATKSDSLLTYTPSVTEGHLNVEVCNATASPQMASGLVFNWRVAR